jgi:hypothetical protein
MSPTNAWPGYLVTGTVSAVCAGILTAFQSLAGIRASDALADPPPFAALVAYHAAPAAAAVAVAVLPCCCSRRLAARRAGSMAVQWDESRGRRCSTGRGAQIYCFVLIALHWAGAGTPMPVLALEAKNSRGEQDSSSFSPPQPPRTLWCPNPLEACDLQTL